MDLDRMLAMCIRDQWSIDDLDWSVAPRAMRPEDEVAVCQYFTDMSGIERLAGALFAVERDRAHDPRLRAIFDTFVADEERHAAVALRLARHYDVHHYRDYALNPHLLRFRGPFLRAIERLPPDIANSYITTGELLLDVALLRSLDDFVDDAMSHRAMRLINRDESRHIAVDYAMAEYYAGPEYAASIAAQPRRSLAERSEGLRAIGGFLYHAAPFFRDVFFAPMDLTDPSGRRLREAFKRVQLLGDRAGMSERPFSRFMWTLQKAFNMPIVGTALGPVIARVMGVDGRVIRRLYTEEELRRANAITIDEMAEEALRAKLVN